MNLSLLSAISATIFFTILSSSTDIVITFFDSGFFDFIMRYHKTLFQMRHLYQHGDFSLTLHLEDSLLPLSHLLQLSFLYFLRFHKSCLKGLRTIKLSPLDYLQLI